VVVPTYNRADRVGRTVASVLAQTDGDLEVVVVDDGSTDNTEAAVRAIDDARVRYVRQVNAGGCAARNAGAAAGRGRWLAFLDDDDVVEPAWLERLRGELHVPGCAIACCGSVHVDDDDATVRVNRPKQLGPVYDNVTAKFDTGTYALTREVFDAAGGFVAGLPSSAHNELALRLVAVCDQRGWSVRSIDEPLVRIHHRQSSDKPRNHPAALYEGTMYVIEHHGARLARNPRTLANWLSVAAVSAFRKGDHREARRLLFRAVRVQPRPRFAARLALAAVPPLARRVWKQSEFTRAERDASRPQAAGTP
jgi:glycosyltransferase involved in cell wall biosynthesis